LNLYIYENNKYKFNKRYTEFLSEGIDKYLNVCGNYYKKDIVKSFNYGI